MTFQGGCVCVGGFCGEADKKEEMNDEDMFWAVGRGLRVYRRGLWSAVRFVCEIYIIVIYFLV